MSARREAAFTRGWLRLTVTVVAITAVVVLSGCSNPTFWFRPPTLAISVKAAPPCPSSVGKARDVSNPIASKSDLLAVSTRPTKGLVCVYAGALGPGRPVKQIVLDASQASRLAMAVRQVSLQSPPSGAVNCPDDAASFAIIALGFSGSPDEDLWWKTSGCQTVDNGTVGASETANNSFFNFQKAASGLIG